jgi:medium-chain acyl-[acyl-carrier-protein] hydrolase
MPSTPWLTFPKPNPTAKLRLFCFPYAGGGASLYRLWAQHLPSEIEVVAVQLPGRETRLREASYTNMTPLVSDLAAALPPFQDKPFAFFGYSLGALVAFEVTRELRRQGLSMPLHLFVAARSAPEIASSRPPIHHLSDAEFIEGLRQYKGTPEEVLQNQELIQLLLPLLRADFTTVETYNYQEEAPLDIPLSAFGGIADEDISREEMDAWRAHTAKNFTLRMLPGDHFFITSARMPLLQSVVRDIAGALR